MVPEKKDRPGVGTEAISKQVMTATTANSTGSTDHGAIAAADYSNGLFRFLWEQAVLAEVDAGRLVSADTVQDKYKLPDLGPATGGLFMGLHRRGQISRCGWRPSTRRSRAGSVVAVWSAGEAR